MTARPDGVAAAAANAVGWSALAGVLLATATVVPHGGLGLLLIAPLLARATTVPRGRLGPTARPLTALFGAPALLLMPLLMAPDPVIRSQWACGTAFMAALVTLPVLTFLAGVVAGAAALGLSAVAARLLARVAPILRGAAVATMGVLLVAASVRTLRRPSADAWAASLPVVARAELPPLEPQPDASPPDATTEVGAPLRFELSQGSRTLLVRRDAHRQWASVGDAAGRGLAQGSPHQDQLALPAGGIEVRTHAGLGYVVVTQQGRPVGALDAATGRLADVPLRAVAGEIAPPWLAIAAAAVGLAAAAARARRAGSERAAMALVASGETATIDETGLVLPDGGGDPFRPPLATASPGPAVILGRPRTGPFRSGGDRGTWVLPGAREAHLAAHRSRAAAFDLEATAAVALAGAPLLAATILGLVL